MSIRHTKCTACGKKSFLGSQDQTKAATKAFRWVHANILPRVLSGAVIEAGPRTISALLGVNGVSCSPDGGKV